MVSGKNSNHDTLGFRRMPALPGAQPFGQVFEAAQGPRGLGQLALARPAGGHGVVVGTGNVLHKVANIVEGQSRGGICHL